MMRKTLGFSLLELMIGIVILAIVAGIAYPVYQNSLLKGRRAVATSTLINMQAAQERYRTSNTTYGTLAQVWGGVSTTPQGFYTLSISGNTGTAYTITATATGLQASDTTCATITLAKSGTTETRSPTVCWQ